MKNIDKNIIYLGWVSFFADMASNMVTTLLPIFVIYVLHEGVDKLGIIIAVATFISYIFRILFGYLSDKYQIVKPFVVVGYLVSAITKPLLFFSNTYISVSLLRGIERMGKAVRSASKDRLISHFVTNQEHGKTFGFHKMMDIAGELMGAFIIFVIFIFFTQDETVIRNIFALTLIPGIISTFIILFFVKDIPSNTQPTNPKSTVINKQDFTLLPILFIYFGFVFFLMSDQFFIVKAKEDGYALNIIPLFIMTFTFVQTISSYYGGVLTDKIGVNKSLIIAFIFAISSILFMQINLWISFVFLGLFTVLSLNALRTLISEQAISKSFVYGIFYGGVAIFSSLGALVIGFIWNRYGVTNVLLFSEIGMMVMLLSFLVFLQIKRNHP
ncbi:MAG: MFS transporter [Sulfurovum sp. FS06-10]|jgi:MFS family permease|nr:MAG: MFS transporter [Sulfurovum sp. FS06-10]